MFAYYLPFSRIFAIILGCLTSLMVDTKFSKLFITHNKLGNLLSILCLIAIAFCLYFMNETFLLPNLLSLLIVIPTAFLIFIEGYNNTYINKLLSNKLLQTIGLSSFSIYLLHWVILAFYKYEYGFDISLFSGVVIFICSIIFGYLSYIFIENTARYKLQHLSFTKILFIFIIIPVIILQGFYSYYRANLTTKFSSELNLCQISDNINHKADNTNCNFNSTNKHPNVILIGDSYASNYINFINTIAQHTKFGFSAISYAGCSTISLRDHKDCANKKHFISTQLKKYDVVLLTQRWSLYLDQTYSSKDEYIIDLRNGLKKLSKHHKIIIIIAEIPILSKFDDYNINDKIHRNMTKINTKRFKETSIEINNLLKIIASEYNNIYYIDVNPFICPDNSCIWQYNNQLLYKDDRHLSSFGSKYLADKYINTGVDKVFYQISKIYNEKNTNLNIANWYK